MNLYYSEIATTPESKIFSGRKLDKCFTLADRNCCQTAFCRLNSEQSRSSSVTDS